MALGITVQARKWAIVEKVAGSEDPSKVRGTIAWWVNQLDKRGDTRKGIRPSMF